MNKVILIGRLTADPELRKTSSGVSCCNFRLAVDRRYTDTNGERQADFINIVAWSSSAEFVAKYFSKGDPICIEGAIQTRSYEDSAGNKRFATEVIVGSVEFAGSRRKEDDS